jgi:hypothetical protein
MYTNVNLSAPIGILSFLAICFVLGLGVLLLAYTIARRKARLRKLTLASLPIVAALYLGVVLCFSLASTETVLARGQEKHFCEIDCHLAYSVVDVQQPKVVGDNNFPDAAGMFWVVTVKTRFDEQTISPTRGDALLNPNSRVVAVIDEKGRQYFPLPQTPRTVDTQEIHSTPITTPLRPAESYTTTFVFDLPNEVKRPTLLIREGEMVTHFIVGHENSPLHKKTRFQL